MLWLAIAAIIAICLLALLWPLLRARPAQASRLDYDLAIHLAQLAELEADRQRGLLSEEAAVNARSEIERRMLRAAERAAPAERPRASWALVTAGGLAIALPFAAALLYAWLGQPYERDRPLASRGDLPVQAEQAAGGDLDDATAALEERLKRQPDDRQGWQLLGQGRWQQGRFADAAEAYARAAALGPVDVNVQMALGEALTFAAQGTVTPAARTAFAKALQVDARNPGARYYLALADLQAGRRSEAYQAWLALARDTAADAPWLPALRRRLIETGNALGRGTMAELPEHFRAEPAQPAQAATAPGPSREDVQAAMQMAPEDRQQFIRSMVERLAERLRQQPDDFEGWMRLGRAHAVLGETAQSEEAYERAAGLQSNDVARATRVAEALIAATPPEAPPTDRAVEAYRRLLALSPEHPEALWYAGIGDLRLGNVVAASEKWRRLLTQLDPNGADHAAIKQQIEALTRR
ncbi:MAG: c-type cytochrome biogenesis protein CcmI [Alphaproteobacteria bacterium]|nr:c-type cytochrome biogenesis protein CcmI [Alphaproteobacteria bacterium]